MRSGSKYGLFSDSFAAPLAPKNGLKNSTGLECDIQNALAGVNTIRDTDQRNA